MLLLICFRQFSPLFDLLRYFSILPCFSLSLRFSVFADTYAGHFAAIAITPRQPPIDIFLSPCHFAATIIFALADAPAFDAMIFRFFAMPA